MPTEEQQPGDIGLITRIAREIRRLRRMNTRLNLRSRRTWQAFVVWFDELGFSENAILLGFGAAIGLFTALGVVAFYRAIDLAYFVLYQTPSPLFERIGFAVHRPVVTAVGLFGAWWIMRRIGRGLDGLNIPDVQLAVARRDGIIPARPAIGRTVASAVTLGAGGSAGSEGPVAVLGSSLGSFLGQIFRFGPDRVRIMVAAGAAAGISAAFNAPLAGAFFALEEILGSLAIGAFPPVVVASVVAAVVSHAFFGNNPAFPIPTEYGFESVLEVVLFYPLLGIVTGLVGVFFVRAYFRTGEYVTSSRFPEHVWPLLGGFVVGAMVMLSDGILAGSGHLAFPLDLFGRLEWYVLLLLVAGKILATSITLSAGGSGGVFTPALFVGAATGGGIGAGLSKIFPGLGLHPEAYALVGMAGLVAAATHAPLTGILIVFEMTNDYAIMMPLMMTTVIAYIVARHWEDDSLYSGWLRRRGERIEHGRDEHVLAAMTIQQAVQRDPQVISADASVTDLLEHLGNGTQTEFPVVDPDGILRGIITTTDLARVARHQSDLAHILVAADIATPTGSIAEGATLLQAVRMMGQRGVATLPVVDPDTQHLIGIVRHVDLIAIYERRLAHSH